MSARGRKNAAVVADGDAAAGGMDRREFLKTALKVGAIGALACLGLRAAKGAASPSPLSETCVLGSPLCSSCASVAGCGHPTGLSYKRAIGGPG